MLVFGTIEPSLVKHNVETIGQKRFIIIIGEAAASDAWGQVDFDVGSVLVDYERYVGS